MIATMLFIKETNSKKYFGLGLTEFLHLPNNGDTIAHRHEKKERWMKVVTILHTANPVSDSAGMPMVYATESSNPDNS
jgi:hypothetical protein